MKILIRFLCWCGLHEWAIMKAGTIREACWVECVHCGNKLTEK